MKKSIVKFWGVALVIIMLSVLFVSAIPASAGTLSFTKTANPNDAVGGIMVAAGVAINDYAVAADGTTIFAATTAGVRKSIDGGKTWSLPTVIPSITASGASYDKIAVCPDNPLLVAVMDATAGGGYDVALTTNGGATWSSLGPPRGVATAVAAATDIAISPTVAGTNNIAVSGSSVGPLPAMFVFTFGITVPGWLDAVAGDGAFTAPVYAAGVTRLSGVSFSPNFNADYICLTVADDTTLFDYYLSALSFNVFDWDVAIPSYTLYPVLITAAGAAGATFASIAFDPNYYGGQSDTRIAYVGMTVAAAAAGKGTYRMFDNAAPAAAYNTLDVKSLSINADGSKLAIGQIGTNNVVMVSNPTSAFLVASTNTRTSKLQGIADGTDNAIVAWGGANLYCANQSTLNSFGISTDNGLTFNIISLLSMTATRIVDQAVNADGTKRYVMLGNAGDVVLFYNDGTSWVATYTAAAAGAFILAPSPDSFETIYMGDMATVNINYSDTAGKGNWFARAATGGGTLADIECVNNSTIYTLTTTPAVSKSTTNGFIWTPATNPGVAAGMTLTVVGEDQLIVGGAAGDVAYTTTLGIPWFVCGAAMPGAGTVFTAADSLAAGSYIYGANTGNANLYRWAISTTTTAWTLVAAGTMASTGVALANGYLYRIGTAAADTEISRGFDQAAIVPVTFKNTDSTADLVLAAAFTGNVGPNAVKMTADNQLWIGNAVGPFNVVTYSDVLANPVNVPALQTPANGAKIQVNNLTGVAYNTNLVWTSASFATSYDIDVAYDDQFVNMSVARITIVFPGGVNPFVATQLLVVGPATGVAATTIAYQPGQILYWRVRAAAPFFTAWSTTYSFSIMPGQALVPQISSPLNGTEVNSLTPGFSWTPIGGAASYKFQVASEPEFAAATTLYDGTATSAGAVLPSTVKLTRGVTYFWRVKALTPTEGDWSAVANFAVAMPVVTTTAAPQVTPTLTVVIPAATTIVTSVPPVTNVTTEVNPSYIWAIIIIGAVLVIAVIVLIVRTRRSV